MTLQVSDYHVFIIYISPLACLPPFFSLFDLECALIKDVPRTATVIARGQLNCAVLPRQGFQRLLGPLFDSIEACH
jgi:hypothetical protein